MSIWDECKPYVVGGFLIGLAIVVTIHACSL